jgi:RNA polymerase sigma-70 factor (ECF subfamily)
VAVIARPLAVDHARRPRLNVVAAPTPPSPAMTQRLLVVSAAQGDPEAFDALVERWLDRLFAVAYRILQDHDAADDATQDALVIAWRDIRGLRDPDRFDAWIHRLLVRICYRHAVKRRREFVRLVDVDGIELGRPDTTNTIADRDLLERAFQRLTLEQRSVLVLHHYLGRSHAEIGDILQLPEGTVASRLHYALKALRAALAADERPGRPVR